MTKHKLTFLLEYFDHDVREELKSTFDPSLGGITYIMHRFKSFLKLYGFSEKAITEFVDLGENEDPRTSDNDIDFKDIDKIVADKKAVSNFKKQLLQSKDFLKTVFRDFLICSREDAREV